MNIVVIGCTLSTQRCLQELVDHHSADSILAVIVLDESLREAKARFVSLHGVADRYGIPLRSVTDINDGAVIDFLRNLAPDLILEVGWSQKIGREILAIPPLGCVGIHDAPLPKGQGAASLNWAIIHGERTWGTSLFYLEERFDAGEVIGQCEYTIDEDDDINSLFDKADECAVELLSKLLPRIRAGTAPRIPQDPALVTKLRRRRPEDGRIDWSRSNREIYNLIRALKKPYPPAFTFLQGRKVFVCEAKPHDARSQGAGVIGSIQDGELVVSTGNQSLVVRLLQAEGEGELDAATFVRTHQVRSGDRFGD